jgi:protein-tyrosine phosphatase
MDKRFVLFFVCAGNICRSPTAEGIMKDMALDEAEHHRIIPIEILSAGINAPEGQPASRFATAVAAEHGIYLNFHRAQLFSPDMAKNADLILTMEKYQTDYIRSRYPGVEQVYELKNYPREISSGYGYSDIPDPIGQSLEVYRMVFDEIRSEVERVSRIIFPLVLKTYGDIKETGE